MALRVTSDSEDGRDTLEVMKEALGIQQANFDAFNEEYQRRIRRPAYTAKENAKDRTTYREKIQTLLAMRERVRRATRDRQLCEKAAAAAAAAAASTCPPPPPVECVLAEKTRVSPADAASVFQLLSMRVGERCAAITPFMHEAIAERERFIENNCSAISVDDIVKNSAYTGARDAILERVLACEKVIDSKQSVQTVVDTLTECIGDLERLLAVYKNEHALVMANLRKRCKAEAIQLHDDDDDDIHKLNADDKGMTEAGDVASLTTRMASVASWVARGTLLAGGGALAIGFGVDMIRPSATVAQKVVVNDNRTFIQNIDNRSVNIDNRSVNIASMIAGSDQVLSAGEAAAYGAARVSGNAGARDDDALEEYDSTQDRRHRVEHGTTGESVISGISGLFSRLGITSSSSSSSAAPVDPPYPLLLPAPSAQHVVDDDQYKEVREEAASIAFNVVQEENVALRRGTRRRAAPEWLTYPK